MMFNLLKKITGKGVDLREKLSEGAIILDVRTKGEFASGHATGAINMPLNELNINKIKQYNKPIIACCASGMRSGAATSKLKANGIEAYNGGSWQKVEQLQ